MNVEKEKVVSISYELRTNASGNEPIEQVDASSPLQFIFGTGYMLPQFEKNLQGLAVGEEFSFQLDPEHAYGMVEQDAIVDLSKELFMMDGKLREDLLVLGNTIPMRDGDGNRIDGRVLEIQDEIVKLDFNHPLAGETLHFKGAIVDIRQASEEEMEHGHIHHDHHDCHGCSHCG